MANEITFKLGNQEAENLWALISNAQIGKLDPSPAVPFALYELRKSLDELRQVPDDEDSIRPEAQMEHCKEKDLSRQYFPKTGIMQWTFEQRLLVILKLVFKSYITTTNGEGVETLLKLCQTLRLNGWFLKNFKKPLSIDLGEDDCDLDEDDCDLDNELVDKKDEVDESAAAAD